jgi:hypothetical protein
MASIATQPKELQDRHRRALLNMLKQPENRECADCRTRNPTWASTNLGIFVCIRCSGLHRQVGTHVTKVKSCTMDIWEPEQIAFMAKMGNGRAKRLWEAQLSADYGKPSEDENDQLVLQWIRMKYERRKFMHPNPEAALLEINAEAKAAAEGRAGGGGGGGAGIRRGVAAPAPPQQQHVAVAAPVVTVSVVAAEPVQPVALDPAIPSAFGAPVAGGFGFAAPGAGFGFVAAAPTTTVSLVPAAPVAGAEAPPPAAALTAAASGFGFVTAAPAAAPTGSAFGFIAASPAAAPVNEVRAASPLSAPPPSADIIVDALFSDKPAPMINFTQLLVASPVGTGAPTSSAPPLPSLGAPSSPVISPAPAFDPFSVLANLGELASAGAAPASPLDPSMPSPGMGSSTFSGADAPPMPALDSLGTGANTPGAVAADGAVDVQRMLQQMQEQQAMLLAQMARLQSQLQSSA